MVYYVVKQPLLMCKSVARVSQPVIAPRDVSGGFMIAFQPGPTRRSSSSLRRWRRVLFTFGLGVMLTCLGSLPADAQGLGGAWRLVSFEGGGSTGPTTGQLLLVDGRWSLIYAMDGAGSLPDGRAHGGGYEAKGQTLTLRVEWSMQNVGGKASVADKPTDNITQFTLQGDQLTIRYKSGGVMQFRWIRAGA
jgi:hypothetical protein